MGFRGVLLRIAEGEEENGAFRVVAPDAEMALPAQQHYNRRKHENALTASAGHVLVVTDHVSSRLLQVTGCASVLLQRETHSALWVAALASQKAATLIEDATRVVEQQQQQRVGSRALPLQQLSLNAWDHSINGSGGGGNGGNLLSGIAAGRSCYCFQFRSSVEFDMFERMIQAYLNIQRMSLLENSVLLEVEIEKELLLKSAAAKASSSSDVITTKRGNRNGNSGAKEELLQERPLTRDELRAAARLQKSRTQGSAAVMSRSIQKTRMVNGGGHSSGAAAAGAKGATPARGRARLADATTPSHAVDANVRCILCTNSQAQTTKPFSKHPFVLQVRGYVVVVTGIIVCYVLRRLTLCGSSVALTRTRVVRTATFAKCACSRC